MNHPLNGLANFVDLIAEEVARQVSIHGAQPFMLDIEAHLIAAEEFGEYTKEVNEVVFRAERRTEMEKELIEAAACLYRHWQRSQGMH